MKERMQGNGSLVVTTAALQQEGSAFRPQIGLWVSVEFACFPCDCLGYSGFLQNSKTTCMFRLTFGQASLTRGFSDFKRIWLVK